MISVIQVHGSPTSKLAHLIADDNNYWTANTALCGARIWAGKFEGKDAFGDQTCVKCSRKAVAMDSPANPSDYDFTFTYPESVYDIPRTGDLYEPVSYWDDLETE